MTSFITDGGVARTIGNSYARGVGHKPRTATVVRRHDPERIRRMTVVIAGTPPLLQRRRSDDLRLILDRPGRE